MNAAGSAAGPALVPSSFTTLSRFVLAAVFLLAGLVFIHYLNGPIWPDAFFDGRVFGRTIGDIRAGHGAYELIHGRDPPLLLLPLVQPPHVAMLMEALAATPIPVKAFDVFFSLCIGAGVIAGVVTSARMFIDATTSGTVLGVGLFAAMFCGGGMIAAVTGNQSGLLMGLIFAAMLPGLRRDDWRLFHAAVVIAVLFKPYFASFWIIPVLQGGWSWKHLWIGVALLAGAGFVYWASAAARPDLLAGWVDLLASRHALGDVGAGIYAMRYQPGESADLQALGLHAIYAGALLMLVIFNAASGSVRLASLAIAAIAINPRMNAYEYAFAAIPVYHVMSVRARQLMPVLGAHLALFATLPIALLTMWLFLNDRFHTNAFLVMALLASVAVATQWRVGVLSLFGLAGRRP